MLYHAPNVDPTQGRGLQTRVKGGQFGKQQQREYGMLLNEALAAIEDEENSFE